LTPIPRATRRDAYFKVDMATSVGMGYTSIIHKVVANSGYDTTLCERWDASTNIFHFPMRELTITLKDV